VRRQTETKSCHTPARTYACARAHTHAHAHTHMHARTTHALTCARERERTHDTQKCVRSWRRSCSWMRWTVRRGRRCLALILRLCEGPLFFLFSLSRALFLYVRTFVCMYMCMSVYACMYMRHTQLYVHETCTIMNVRTYSETHTHTRSATHTHTRTQSHSHHTHTNLAAVWW